MQSSQQALEVVAQLLHSKPKADAETGTFDVAMRGCIDEIASRLTDPSPDVQPPRSFEIARKAQLLHAQDWRVRRTAAETMGKLGPASSGHAPEVAALLEDSHPLVRQAAISALAEIGQAGDMYAGAVSERLSDEDTSVRISAAQTLSVAIKRSGAQVYSEQVHAKAEVAGKDPVSAVRGAAREALRALFEFSKPYGPVRHTALLHDDDWQVRLAAVQALAAAGTGAQGAVEALATLVNDNDERIRKAALETLPAIHCPLVEQVRIASGALTDRSPVVREAAASAVGAAREVGATSADALSGVLEDPSSGVRKAAREALASQDASDQHLAACHASALEHSSWRQRVAAARALGQLGKSAAMHAPALARQLCDEETCVRQAAAQALAGMGAVDQAPHVAKLLEDESNAVRRSAVEALRIWGGAAADHVVDKLTHVDPDVRRAAADALNFEGCIPAHQAQRFNALILDADGDVRVTGIEGLGGLDSHGLKFCDSLVTALEDEEAQVRVAALNALRSLGNAALKPSASAISVCLQDSETSVILAAVEAVSSLGEDAGEHWSAVADLLGSEHAAVRTSVAEALRAKAGEHVWTAKKKLHDGDREVRSAAASALRTARGATEASETQRQTALLEDSDWRVRREAIEFLGEIIGCMMVKRGVEQQRAALLEGITGALKDEEPLVRKAALQALSRAGFAAENHVDSIASMLQDLPEVRRTASIVLGCIGGKAAEATAIYLKDDDVTIRRAAIDALVRMREGSKHLLAQRYAAQLKDPNWKTRRDAAEQLGRMGTDASGAEEDLRVALHDPDQDVQNCAAEALGLIGTPAAVACAKDLVGLLSDKNVRHSAGVSLRRLGSEATCEAVAKLEDEDPDARSAAAVVIGSSDAYKPGWEARAAPRRAALLRDTGAAARNAATIALGMTGAAAAPHAAAQARDERPEVRSAALDALALIGKAACPEAGKAAAQLNDPDSTVRCKAVEALRAMGEGAGAFVDAVAQRLSDEDATVRIAAVNALGFLGSRSVQHAGAVVDQLRNAATRPAAMEALEAQAETWSAVAAPRASELLDDDDGLVRRAAAHALAWMGAPAKIYEVKKWLALLRDEDWQERLSAVKALGRLADSKTGPSVAHLLGDDDPFVRAQVAEVLPTIGGGAPTANAAASYLDSDDWHIRRSASDALSNLEKAVGLDPPFNVQRHRVLLADPDAHRRAGAASALGKLRAVECANSVAELLSDASSMARCAAVEALGRLSPSAACHAPNVVGLLADIDPGVRRAAVEALGHMSKEPQDLKALALRLNDSDQAVRHTAAKMLGKVDEVDKNPAVAVLDHPSEDTRRAASEAVGLLGASASHLQGKRQAVLLGDSDCRIRAAAAEALGRLGLDAKPQSQELVAKLSDSDWGVRAAAARALGRIGEAVSADATSGSQPEALGISELEKLLKDPVPAVRRAAVEALQAIKNLSPEEEAKCHIALLSDPDWQVRRNAADTLGRLGIAASQHADGVAKMLQDEDPYVQRAAAGALGRMGAPAARHAASLGALVNCAGDPFLSRAATDALAKSSSVVSGRTALLPELMRDPAVKHVSAATLAKRMLSGDKKAESKDVGNRAKVMLSASKVVT